jgi:Fe-S-cluster-containing hydrogenase component 2
MENHESMNALTTPPAIGGAMTKHQLQAELLRCEYCEEKPCKQACPANCSPFDFIMAARVGIHQI